MAKSKNKTTKVLAFDTDHTRLKKLKDLQKTIDDGQYKVSPTDIAKACLYKAGIEFNTLNEENFKKKKVDLRLEVIKKNNQPT